MPILDIKKLTENEEALRDFTSMPMEQQRKLLSDSFPNFKYKYPAEQNKILEDLNAMVHGKISKPLPGWTKGAETAFELGGLSLGLIPGIPGGPAGAALTSGLGYAAGRQAYDRMMESLGYKKRPSTMEEAFVKTGLDIPFGAAQYGGAEIIAQKGIPLISKLFPFYKKGVGPESEKIRLLAKEKGVYLTPPDIAGAPGQAKLYSGLNILPSSSTTIQNEAIKSIESYLKYGKRLRGEFGKPIESYELGTKIKTGALESYEARLNEEKRLFDKARDLAKDVQVNFTKTKEEGKEILGSDEFNILPSELKRTIKNIISRTQKKTITEEGELTIEDLPRNFLSAEELRRSVANAGKSQTVFQNNAQRLFNKLKNAIESDMENAAESAGSDAYHSFLEARRYSRENIFGKFEGKTEYFQKSLGEKILRGEPEDILKMIKNPTGLEQIKELIPDKTFKIAKEGILTEMFENASGNMRIGNKTVRYIDPNKLEKIIENYNKEYLRILLTQEEKISIQEYIKLGKALNTADKIAGNPSGTSPAWYMGQLLTGAIPAGVFGGGDVKDRLTRALSFGTGFLFAPWFMAKMITSPMGRKYMIQGFPISTAGQTAIKGGILGLEQKIFPSPYEKMATEIME